MTGGIGAALIRLVVQRFSRPDMTALQLRKRAETAILCGPLFVLPLLLMHDSLPSAVKIVLQACWCGSLFIGYVLYAEHKKRDR
ncbi:hypothetical protein [Pantoea agglomerans]|uniref:hypothetical protein n=1 Tax=Enterobacter agglomerans TaxID=549 RepID=UPI00320B5B4B